MDKSLLLTGGSGGLGTTVVKALLEEGWKIYAPVRSDSSREKMKSDFSEEVGKHLIILDGNVTKEDDVARFVEQAGSIDALVHIAGGFRGQKKLEDYSLEEYQFLFSLNTLSTFLLLKYVLPGMRRRKTGQVVMIGAKPALYPSGANAVYAASKAALINLVLSAAEEGRSEGVNANLIVPAVIDTPANREWATEEEIKKWTSPQAIADTIAWLVSDRAKKVTGTIFPMYNKLKTF